MRKLSPETREILSNDEFMKTCCLKDETCGGRIEWHHNGKFGGRQTDIPSTILPLCHDHHRIADYKLIKEILNHIMLNRMSDAEIKSISKAVDYFRERARLNQLYDVNN